MKKLVVLLMAMLVATSAVAIVDPDDNMMGFYFDMEADMPCAEGVAPYAQLPMYLVMTNMTDDALYGFEAGYDIVGNAMVLATVFANPGIIDVGGPGNHIVGYGSPSMTAPVTLLATLNVMYMDTMMGPVEFFLHGTEPSTFDSRFPTILLANSVAMGVGMSAADGPTAQINAGCSVVATENVSFDGIKSLYR